MLGKPGFSPSLFRLSSSQFHLSVETEMETSVSMLEVRGIFKPGFRIASRFDSPASFSFRAS